MHLVEEIAALMHDAYTREAKSRDPDFSTLPWEQVAAKYQTSARYYRAVAQAVVERLCPDAMTIDNGAGI